MAAWVVDGGGGGGRKEGRKEDDGDGWIEDEAAREKGHAGSISFCSGAAGGWF